MVWGPGQRENNSGRQQEPSAMDQFAQDARIRKGARMLPQDRKLTAGEIDAVRADLAAFTDPGGGKRTQAWVSRNLGAGYSAAVVSGFINGKPNSRDEEIARAVNEMLEIETARAKGVRPTVFVETGVAREILTVCTQARVHLAMGEILGPAGVGKSITLRACAQKIPGSVYLRCSESTAQPLAFLRSLAAAIGVGQTGSMDLVMRRIVDRLSSSGRLLLLDEAQKLSKRTIDVLRDLHDMAEIPIVICGTLLLRDMVNDANIFYGQLSSRIMVRVNLAERFAERGGGAGRSKPGDHKPLFTVEEVVEALGLSQGHLRLTDEAVAYLTSIACAPGLGCLRLCSQLVRALEKMPYYRRNEVTDKSIRRVLRELHGIDMRDQIESRVEQTTTQQRKTA
ncbi:MAG: AAA family ATPase [Planctomycetes bacterium]|nr:AAA family ATPase [Planctomycetota bacterium]